MTTLQKDNVAASAIVIFMVTLVVIPQVATGLMIAGQSNPTAPQTQSQPIDGGTGGYSEDNSTDFDFSRDDSPPEYVIDGTPTRLQWFQLWSYKNNNVFASYVDKYNITDQRISEVFLQDKLWQTPPTAPFNWNNRNFGDIQTGGDDTSYYPESANTKNALGIEDAHLTIHSYGPRTTLVNGNEKQNFINGEFVNINGFVDYRESSIDGDDYSDAENIRVDYEVTEIRFIQDGDVIKTIDGRKEFGWSITPDDSIGFDEETFTVEADIEGEVKYDVPPPPDDGDDDDDDDDNGGNDPPNCLPGSPACAGDPISSPGDGGDGGDDDDGFDDDPTDCGRGDPACIRNVDSQTQSNDYGGIQSEIGASVAPDSTQTKQATPPDSVEITVSDSFSARVEDIGGYAKVATFPDGNARYYINPQAKAPWDSVELPNGQTVNNGWQYYSHRDTSWDTIMRSTEDGEEVVRDGIDPNEIFWANGSNMRPARTKAVPTDIENQLAGENFTIGDRSSFEDTPEGVTDVNENVGFIRPNEPFERIYGLEIITNEPKVEGTPKINGFVYGTQGETEIVSEYDVNYADLSTDVISYNNASGTAELQITLTDNNGNPINTDDRGRESWIEVNNERYDTGVDGEVVVTVDKQPNVVITHHPHPWWQSWPTDQRNPQGPIQDPDSISTPPDVDKKFAEQSTTVDTTTGNVPYLYFFDMLGVLAFVLLLLFISLKSIDIVFGTSLWPFWR